MDTKKIEFSVTVQTAVLLRNAGALYGFMVEYFSV